MVDFYGVLIKPTLWHHLRIQLLLFYLHLSTIKISSSQNCSAKKVLKKTPQSCDKKTRILDTQHTNMPYHFAWHTNSKPPINCCSILADTYDRDYQLLKIIFRNSIMNRHRGMVYWNKPSKGKIVWYVVISIVLLSWTWTNV